ncbi:hypothetical protein AALA99_03160 [Anaerotruncus colihominis]
MKRTHLFFRDSHTIAKGYAPINGQDGIGTRLLIAPATKGQISVL